VAKLESHSPTGSLKDRMALAVVDRAAATGRLVPGGRLIEYTGGSTGTSLAFVCAARGFDCGIVTSDAFSAEKRDHMRALGAAVEVIPSEDGRITRDLIRAMMARAEELAAAPGAFYADQFHNRDATAGYEPLGDEIREQCGAPVDAFVHAVGTAHSIIGCGRALRRHDPGIRVLAVEPAESAVLSGGEPGGHRIEGIGAGFVPPAWPEARVDGVETVSSADAMAMSRRLAREQALFVGTSSGANVVAALREAERLGPGATVATLLCDSGLKYLTTELFREERDPPRVPSA
jgi:cysteine synthase A